MTMTFKDALIANLHGKKVECNHATWQAKEWKSLQQEFASLKLEHVGVSDWNAHYKFRLAPRTILVNPEYAFPQSLQVGDRAMSTGGLTLRDYFAAQALPAVYVEACKEMDKTGYPEHWKNGVALDAYAMADAMLAERAKGGEA